MKHEYAPGATPLDPDESQGLIPSHITTQGQLNDYEEANILAARRWAYGRKRRGDPLDREFIRNVHRRMFNKTWKWAGDFRRSDKNIGCQWTQVPTQLYMLAGDVRAQIQCKSYREDEIAARFHHRLVLIHSFPNGNGRHARFMADLLRKDLTSQIFTWGQGQLVSAGDTRSAYINALRAADRGDYGPLLLFLEITQTMKANA
jgi:Fic-DOC domain mobile mystery protein B